MGVRLSRFQNYFRQAHPLIVTSKIGGELGSSFSMVVDNVQQVDDNQLVLASGTGEIRLIEEEIYRVGPAVDGQYLSLLMDGGIELRFSPLNGSGFQPVQ